jgi:K+-sensing histidine kinase KdpD
MFVVAVSVLIATLLTFLIAPRVIHSRDLFFVAAVILVSRYQGRAPGICVAILSMLAFNWYFDPTPALLDFSTGNVIRTTVFLSISAMVALLDHQRRKAMQEVLTTNQALQAALEKIKTLHGILPICSYCKKIQADPETWIDLENYVRKHSDAEFSHGLCPECLRKLYPEVAGVLR